MLQEPVQQFVAVAAVAVVAGNNLCDCNAVAPGAAVVVVAVAVVAEAVAAVAGQ